MKLLIIEDDINLASTLARRLTKQGFICDVAHNQSDALLRARQIVPDSILLDMKLGDDNGLMLIKPLRNLLENTHIVLLTGNGNPDLAKGNNINQPIVSLNIPTKSTKSRPSQFFLDKLITPILKIWPAPENSTDVIVFNKLVRMDDADKQTNTLDMPFRFYPCFAAGLAYYIAIKKSPERVVMLKQMYEEEFERAMSQDEDRASFRIAPYKPGL